MSSAFLRAVRTSSVRSLICLLVFLNCFPAFLTCLATSPKPAPLPGTFIPRIFFGLPPSRVPSTTPPTRPAAAVATPAITGVFEDPLPFELPRLLEPLPLFEPLRLLELLEAFGLLRELVALELPDLLRPLDALLFDALPLREDDPLALEPFELPEDDFRLVEERVFPWAITPP